MQLWARQLSSVQFSSVTQSCPILFDPMDSACQASLSITDSWSLFKLMSIKSVMPSNHLILCHPLLLLPSIFPSIRVCSSELAQWLWCMDLVAPRGFFLDQGSNPCLLHCQMDSLPLSHQGNPSYPYFK